MGWGGARPGAGRKKDPAKLKVVGGTDSVPAAPRKSKQPARTWPSPDSIAIVLEALKSSSRLKKRGDSPLLNPFQLPQPAPGVLPKNVQIAMDEAGCFTWANNSWAGGMLANAAAEGLLFPGYPYLSELTQRPEYRVMAETIADDATRKWVDFEVTGEKDKDKDSSGDPEHAQDRDIEEGDTPAKRLSPPDEREDKLKSSGKLEKVKAIKDEMERLHVRDCFYSMSRDDGFFGRSHPLLHFQDSEDPSMLATPVGDGRDTMSKHFVQAKGGIERIQVVEPVWTYPMVYNATNPIQSGWYDPQMWYVMGQQIHVSRMPAFITRPVPDLLKPAYSFGGISLSQLAQPYVDIWLRTRQSVADIVHSFSVMVLMTDLQTLLQPAAGGMDILTRVAMFNEFRDNAGAFVVNKATEDFKNVAAPVSGLDHLQAQAQEHMSTVSRIPLVKLTGISPSGLNASSEGEIRVYYDTITAYQNRNFRPLLTRIINFIQLALFGEIDPEITFQFESLYEMSEKENAELQKAQAERDKIYVEGGAISPEEWRKALIDDPKLPFTDLDPDDVPDLKEEEEEGLAIQGAGGAEKAILGGGKEPGGAEDADLPFGRDASEFHEGDHPRAPDGKFGSGGGSSSKAAKTDSPLKPAEMKRVGKQMGSNPGGVFENAAGERFYVKAGQSQDHVANELAAADLYKLAGAPTLNYRPVEGGKHIATEMSKLDKSRATEFSPAEVAKAREDFVAHAWLANWDAVGTGSDNLGTIKGVPTALDLGGALSFRAQGAPKGAAFGSTVGELDTMRSKQVSPDSARIFGTMSTADLRKSAEKVTRIPDEAIRKIVGARDLPEEVATKLIARKQDIAKRFGLQAMDEKGFEEGKHKRDADGKFSSTGGGGASKSENEGLLKALENISGGPSGEEPPKFKTKTEHVGYLLQKGGLTTAEVLKATGWPSVSMPQVAGILGMKLEKSKEGGVTKYKGTPMTPDEFKEFKEAAKALKAAKAAGKAAGEPVAPAKVAPAPEPKVAPAAASEPLATLKELVKKFSPAFYAKAGEIDNLAMSPLQAGKEKVKAAVQSGDATVAALEEMLKPQEKAELMKNYGSLEHVYAKSKQYHEAAQKQQQAMAAQKAAQESLHTKKAEEAAKQQAEIDTFIKEHPDAKVHMEAMEAIIGGGGATKQYIAEAKNRVKSAGLEDKISPVEAVSIIAYSGSHYGAVNRQLRDGVMTVDQYKFMKSLNAALDKLPAYTEVTGRKADLKPEDFKRYKTGHIVEERAFTSSSKNKSVWSGDHHYTIHGKTGRDISKLSSHQSEAEVLFKSGTRFLVESVQSNHIVLREVD